MKNHGFQGSNGVLEKIRQGDRKFLQELYDQHREAFVVWASKHYQCGEETSAEVYQQSFINLYYNVRDQKLTDLKSSIKTYLFAIGKNLLRDQFKITQRRQEILEVAVDTDEVDHSIFHRYEQANMKEVVRQLLSKIGEPCKTVLDLFYFRGYAMDAIADHMQYKSHQIAAKRKFICLRQMRSLLVEAQELGEI